MADRGGYLTTTAEIDALFGAPSEAALRKETAVVTPEYRAMIEASPFAIVATSGPGGLDASPRGDPAGFVVVESDRTLLLPERPGNNRADSLHNLVHDPRIALLFLIPGVGETLRVNGRARISVAPALLERFRMQGRPPRCVVEIEVESVFFQCARAIHRSKLWSGSAPAAAVPTAGTILQATSGGAIDGVEYDRTLRARQRDTLY